jgi:hypothetical protein
VALRRCIGSQYEVFARWRIRPVKANGRLGPRPGRQVTELIRRGEYRGSLTAAAAAATARTSNPERWGPTPTHVVLLSDVHPLPVLVHPQRLGLAQRLDFLPVIVVSRLRERLEGKRRGDDEGEERESEEDKWVTSDLGKDGMGRGAGAGREGGHGGVIRGRQINREVGKRGMGRRDCLGAAD